MRILSIETSCDETALSIVKAEGGIKNPRFNVIKSLISSQIPIHRPFGGVVPSLAKREHIKNLPKLFKRMGISAGAKEIDAIAITVGPGLEPALWTGIEFSKNLAAHLKKPLFGANHMEGHMFSVLLPHADGKQVKMAFPAIGLVVSGGHTILVHMNSLSKWTKLGETRDDAAGEAFDKVARLMKLPYPGGPEISKLAKKGNPKALNFPRPMLANKDYDFSFSGLKTAVLYHLRDHAKASKADVAASFQQAVLDVLIKKTVRAAQEFEAQSVFICGGVAANSELRSQLGKECEKRGLQFFIPSHEYNTDNAAMIAAAAYLAKLRKKMYPMIANSNMTL